MKTIVLVLCSIASAVILIAIHPAEPKRIKNPPFFLAGTHYDSATQK